MELRNFETTAESWLIVERDQKRSEGKLVYMRFSPTASLIVRKSAQDGALNMLHDTIGWRGPHKFKTSKI